MTKQSEYYTFDELEQLGLKSHGDRVLIHRLAHLVNPAAISIGSHVRIDPYVIISAGETVEIGNHIHIGAYSYLAGKHGITLADFSNLSQGVRIYSVSDDYSGACLTNPTIPKKYSKTIDGKVVIGRHVIIGSNSVVLPGVIIDEGCAVGALSLVRSSLEPWGIYVGVPVRRSGERNKTLLEYERQLQEEEKKENAKPA